MFEHRMITATAVNLGKMKMDDGVGSMNHDDPNSVLINPGQSAELVWKFAKSKDLEFACNIPGRYDAGMMGNILIEINK